MSLGEAVIDIVADTSGLSKSIGDGVEKGSQGAGAKSGKTVGSRMAGALTKSLKVGVVGAVGAVTGVAGTALVKGFSRLKGIDEAQAKLRGLGHDAASIQKVMENATAAVTGTAYGLDSAATTAAGALAAGVKPGEDLTRTLKQVTDVATLTGGSMEEIGGIFNKVAANNKIQMDSINQLQDRGFPILQMLAKELGVTAEEASKMASAGKVDFNTFRNAVEGSLGPAGTAAAESGKTFAGAFANLQAALGRLGARFLGPAFGGAVGLFNSLGSAIDSLGPIAEKAGLIFGEFFQRFAGADFGSLTAGVPGAIEVVTSALDSVMPKLQPFAGVLAGIASAAVELAQALIPVAARLAEAAAVTGIPILLASMEALRLTIEAVAAAAGLLSLWAEKSPGSFKAVAVTILAIAAAVKAVRIAMAAWITLTKAWAAVTKAAIAVQAAFNIVMALNPFTIIVVAIVAVVAALTYFFTQTETGRKIIKKAWEGIRAAIGAVVDWITGPMIDGLKAAWDAVTGAAVAAWNAIKATINAVLDAIAFVINAVLGAIKWVITTYFTIYRTIITTAFNLIKGAVQFAWDAIKAVFEAVLAAISWVITTYFEIYKAVITTALTVIRTVITAAWDAIRTVTSTVWDAIRAVLTAIWGAIRAVATSVFNAIKNVVLGVWNAVRSAATTAWNAVSEAVRTAINRIYEMVGRIKGNILGIFSGAGGWLLEAGKQVMRGFVSGLESGVGWVKDTLGSVTKLIPKIKGPEDVDRKLLTKNGELIMAGLVKGLTIGESDVIKTLEGLTNKIGDLGVSRIGASLQAPATAAVVSPLAPSRASKNTAPIPLPAPSTSPVDVQSLRAEISRLTAAINSGPGAATEVNIDQNFYGPQTGADRLKELEWTMRYAPRRPGANPLTGAQR